MQRFIYACFVFFPLLSWAHPIALNAPLPSVSIPASASSGELQLDTKGHFNYSAWHQDMLLNKVRVVFHIAGRTQAKVINNELLDALKAAQFPQDKYQTTTLINVDDAIIGTSSFVRRQAKKSKTQFPWSSIVLDSNGSIQKSWVLMPKSSAVLLLNPLGQVLFFKDGQLTSQEVSWVVEKIRQLIQ